MQLPLDLKALVDEVTNIKEAYNTEISVSVYVDDLAPADLVAHVRNAFASSLSTVRFTLTYLDNNFMPQPNDDIAIIVAGVSKKVGPCAAALRAVGVPTMVVATAPNALSELIGSSSAIPDGDLIAPPAAEDAVEPIALDDAARESLNERMGSWIVSICRDKRVAYAVAFPFVRKPLATDSVQLTALQNAGIGLAPIIPGADLPILTLNQAKMVLQIAAAYGMELERDRIKELAAVVGGAYLCRSLARQLVEFVPVLGFAIRSGIAYGGTAAIGYAVIAYFEGGENVAGVTNVMSRAASAGTKLVSTVNKTTKELAPRLRNIADQGAPAIRDMASEYLPKLVDSTTDIISKAFGIR